MTSTPASEHALCCPPSGRSSRSMTDICPVGSQCPMPFVSRRPVRANLSCVTCQPFLRSLDVCDAMSASNPSTGMGWVLSTSHRGLERACEALYACPKALDKGDQSLAPSNYSREPLPPQGPSLSRDQASGLP